MNIDRKLQREMLEMLKKTYPGPNDEFQSRFEPHPDYSANLYYLKEHGLISAIDAGTFQNRFQLIDERITVAGLDFLEDDGGLSAILRTFTVRIDAEQLRQILAAKIESLPITPETTPEKKSTILAKLRELPAEVLYKLVLHLAEKGIEHFPEVLMDYLQILSRL